MILAPSVVTAAADYPVTLTEAKDALRITTHHDDVRVRELIAAATEVLENTTGRAFIDRTLRLNLTEFPTSTYEFTLPYPPLSSITQIDYYDGDEVLQTMDSGDYQIWNPPKVHGKLCPVSGGTWPGTCPNRYDAVQITYVAGYGTSQADVPPSARQWMFLCMRHWYDNPSAVITGTVSSEVALAAEALEDTLGTGYYADV